MALKASAAFDKLQLLIFPPCPAMAISFRQFSQANQASLCLSHLGQSHVDNITMLYIHTQSSLNMQWSAA